MMPETRAKYIDFIANLSKPEVRDGIRDMAKTMSDEQLQKLFDLYYAKTEASLSEYVKKKGW